MIICVLAGWSIRAEKILVEAENIRNSDGSFLFEPYQSPWDSYNKQHDVPGKPNYDDNPRSWYINQQMMDIRGSSYIIAHGFGIPVPDVGTEITVSEGGTYRVYAATRDWAMPEGSGAGLFEIHINGTPLDTVFGNRGGGEWIWQDGGTVELSPGTTHLTLHDLNGWQARVDAVFLTNEAEYTPPNDFDGMMTLRRKLCDIPPPMEAGDFDLVVIGGGIAGCCAALSAANAGLKTALINDRPEFGGNGILGVPVGAPEDEFLFPRNMDYHTPNGRWHHLIHEYGKWRDENRDLHSYVKPEKLHLFPNIHVMQVEMESDRKLKTVIGTHIATSKLYRYRAPIFLDATGDGTVAHHAGAEYRMGRESKAMTGEPDAVDVADSMHLPFSVYWDPIEEDTVSTWPELPWFIMPLSCDALPKAHYDNREGHWVPPFKGRELIRDHMFQKTFGAWAWAKNNPEMAAEAANHRPEYHPHLILPRESRRIMGDYVYSELDIIEKRQFPDGVVIAGYWLDSFQMPGAKKKNRCHWEEGTGYAKVLAKAAVPRNMQKVAKSYDYPTEIPFRVYYSKDVDNLFLGGRNVSCTHIAHGKLRIQGTTAMAGTMVGRASYLCRKHEVNPRELYENHLDDLLAILENPDNLPPIEHWESGEVPVIRTAATTHRRRPTGPIKIYTITGRCLGTFTSDQQARKMNSSTGAGIYLRERAHRTGAVVELVK